MGGPGVWGPGRSRPASAASTALEASIHGVRGELEASIHGVRGELEARIGGLRGEMRAWMTVIPSLGARGRRGAARMIQLLQTAWARMIGWVVAFVCAYLQGN
jgi:hypothetical protein